MNDIIKDPHNIRSGQEWLEIMPDQLQTKWISYTLRENNKKFLNYKLQTKGTFYDFICGSFLFKYTEEGVAYWDSIAQGYFGVNQKKSLWSKIINFFKL